MCTKRPAAKKVALEEHHHGYRKQKVGEKIMSDDRGDDGRASVEEIQGMKDMFHFFFLERTVSISFSY